MPTPDRAALVDVLFAGHATVRLDVAGLRVVTDPLLRGALGPLARHGVLPDVRALADADVVLVSHGHPDHFDRRSLRALAVLGARLIVVPRGLGSAAARAVGDATTEVVELAAGDRLTVRGMAIEAVPASHWVTPGAPRAAPIGYLVGDDPGTWFAGDTGRFPGMRDLAGRVGLALLPVWTWGPHLGPGHLGPRSAAEVMVEVGPAAAIPIHWGTLYPRRLHHVLSAPLREPGDRFATEAARLAPTADVRVLRPGESTTLWLPDRDRGGGPIPGPSLPSPA